LIIPETRLLFVRQGLKVMIKNMLGELRSACPLAAGLDAFGDKWSLLVVRDMLLHDKHRYGEFLASEETIPSSILANRLRRLASLGIIEKIEYQRRPVRHEYYLTEMGQDLEPVVMAIIAWGLRHVPETGHPGE
jgi:DNA-binding HxlR family transcriptional regulator